MMATLPPEPLLRVLHEEADLLVLTKPAGLVFEPRERGVGVVGESGLGGIVRDAVGAGDTVFRLFDVAGTQGHALPVRNDHFA